MCVVGKAQKALHTQKHVRPCLRLGCVAMLTPGSQNPHQDTCVFSGLEKGDAVGTEDEEHCVSSGYVSCVNNIKSI